jgi:hypothetical protein
MSIAEGAGVVPRIAYPEYRAIGKLLEAHVDLYGGRLRAMVAFGPLVTTGLTYDIDLVEVIEGWDSATQGRYGEFVSTATLPLRGGLRLYFLSPQEFEAPGDIGDEAEQRWVYDLKDRLSQGYEIVMEAPPGYARRILEGGRVISTLTAPPSGTVTSDNPLHP